MASGQTKETIFNRTDGWVLESFKPWHQSTCDPSIETHNNYVLKEIWPQTRRRDHERLRSESLKGKSSSWLKPPHHLPKGRNRPHQEPTVFKEAQVTKRSGKLHIGRGRSHNRRKRTHKGRWKPHRWKGETKRNKEGGEKKERDGGGGSRWVGRGHAWPQEKRKGRADGGQGEGKRKRGGGWARGLGFQIWKQKSLREFRREDRTIFLNPSPLAQPPPLFLVPTGHFNLYGRHSDPMMAQILGLHHNEPTDHWHLHSSTSWDFFPLSSLQLRLGLSSFLQTKMASVVVPRSHDEGEAFCDWVLIFSRCSIVLVLAWQQMLLELSTHHQSQSQKEAFQFQEAFCVEFCETLWGEKILNEVRNGCGKWK